MSTSAALTSIQALSPADWAAVTRWSSCASLSFTALELSEALEDAAAGELGAGAGVCCASRGTAASTMVMTRQHFHPTCFINYVRSAAFGLVRRCRAILKKRLPGTHPFFDWDYTRGNRMSYLEICIRQIHFSDLLCGRRAARGWTSLRSRGRGFRRHFL